MCSPSIPKAPPPPPEPLKNVDDAMAKAREDQRRKALLMSGLSGTNPTGGQGVTGQASVVGKTLLGQ